MKKWQSGRPMRVLEFTCIFMVLYQEMIQGEHFLQGVLYKRYRIQLPKVERVLRLSRVLALDLARAKRPLLGAGANLRMVKRRSSARTTLNDLSTATDVQMSISPSLRATARSAYRDLLRASSVTFAEDVPVRNGE